MAACIYSSYDSDNLQIDYYAEYGRDDNLDKDSIEILSLHILGEKVSFHLLPKNLQAAILDLHNDSI